MHMSTSRGLQAKIRAYQDAHGVNYTTARRAVLAANVATGSLPPEPQPASLDELPSLLLPFPDGKIELPPGLTGDERMHAAFEAALDHLNAHAMAWPARDTEGHLVPPPDSHVAHHLALTYGLGDEEEMLILPSVHTVAVVDELPSCWRCGHEARYDSRVVDVNGRTAGAYVCTADYDLEGSGTLGATGDVYLMLSREVPMNVRTLVNLHMVARGRETLSFE